MSLVMVIMSYKNGSFHKLDWLFFTRQCDKIGCGSVGRAVASGTRGLRFESSNWQNLYWTLFTVYCIEKMKIKKKEAGNGPPKNCLLKSKLFQIWTIMVEMKGSCEKCWSIWVIFIHYATRTVKEKNLLLKNILTNEQSYERSTTVIYWAIDFCGRHFKLKEI